MGYIKSMNVINNGFNLNDCLGNKQKKISAGISISPSQWPSGMIISDINNDRAPLNYANTSLTKFKSGDKLKLVFDFLINIIQIYHNNNFIDKVSLNGNKCVIPGVSLCRPGYSVKIGKYNFYK